jgi:LmbE family N-acetylglucosaminyl deacetylase
LGVRTLLFSITRGEGGANLISDDFFDELGALRTLEHQKAADYYGSEIFYSRAADYGYSKSLDEANFPEPGFEGQHRGLPHGARAARRP